MNDELGYAGMITSCIATNWQCMPKTGTCIKCDAFSYCRELEKIQVEGEDLYLPTAPSKLVRGIRVDSGIPLQSAAKVPIMVTFDVVDRYGDRNEIMPQACIFKVVPFNTCDKT